MIEREEGRIRSAHSIDMAYKQFLSNNIQGGLVGEAWYNQVRIVDIQSCVKSKVIKSILATHS